MGLEETISNFNPKTVKLFDNIITILIVVTLIYVLLSFVFGGYIDKPISFFGDPAFTGGLIIGIFLGVGYKLLHGGTIHIPEQSKQKTELKMPDVWGVNSMKDGVKPSSSQTRQFNFPDTWGVKKYKKTSVTKPPPRQKGSYSHKSKGSWNCPKCRFLNVGTTTCKKCGHKK